MKELADVLITMGGSKAERLAARRPFLKSAVFGYYVGGQSGTTSSLATGVLF
jgi:hypothetical protein